MKKAEPVRNALEKKDGDLTVLGVLVTKIRKITTKKGQMMAFLTMEDKSGMVDGIVFPRTYEVLKDELVSGKPMLVAGRLNVRDQEKSIAVEKAKYIDEERFGSKFDGVTFRIRPSHMEK